MRVVLAKSTTDRIKSKILSPQVCELVFEVYMSPQEFATLLDNYFDKEFNISIDDKE